MRNPFFKPFVSLFTPKIYFSFIKYFRISPYYVEKFGQSILEIFSKNIISSLLIYHTIRSVYLYHIQGLRASKKLFLLFLIFLTKTCQLMNYWSVNINYFTAYKTAELIPDLEAGRK